MSRTAPPISELYRAVWRWHFYAGLLVLPVLILLAVTGALYLFKDEVDGLIYRPLRTVEARPYQLDPQDWRLSAEIGGGGRVVRLTAPEPGAGRAVEAVVETPDGRRLSAFVDPHDGRYMGATSYGGVNEIIKRLHSLDLFGPAANLLVELAAGWAVVLVVTGVYLWWPRGRTGGVVTVRGPPSRRLFWRDLHAVTGALAGGLIVFLAATGMPWSPVWGESVQSLVAERGWGRPPAPAAHAQPGHEDHTVPAAVPWALEDAAVHGAAHAALNLDAAVRRADAAGLPRPFTVSVPGEAGRAWPVAHMPDRVENTRTLYLDPADGRILADLRYADFGPGAQAIEWGISVHQGQQFGRANQLVMLLACLAILAMSVTAVVMWWGRRPHGRLAAPPAPADPRVYLGLIGIIAPLGLFYPLVGASMILALALDLGARRLKVIRPASVEPA